MSPRLLPNCPPFSWSYDVEFLPCPRGCKLESSFKNSISCSFPLFSELTFKNIAQWRFIRLTFQNQPNKRYASTAESIVTSSSTYQLTQAKWSKMPLSFGSTFRRIPARSSQWKAYQVLKSWYHIDSIFTWVERVSDYNSIGTIILDLTMDDTTQSTPL